jgi:hypothetical protein
MSYFSSLNLTNYDRQHQSNPIVARRMKLASKIDQQIKLCADAAYRPIRSVWVKNDAGQQELTNKAVRIQRWWDETEGGKVLLTIRYGAKVLQLAEGKNAIELTSKNEVAEVLEKVRMAVIAGELDAEISTALGLRKLVFRGRNNSKSN